MGMLICNTALNKIGYDCFKEVTRRQPLAMLTPSLLSLRFTTWKAMMHKDYEETPRYFETGLNLDGKRCVRYLKGD